MPIGNEAEVFCMGVPGFNRSDNSRSQTPNFATTNPKLMIEMLVRIHAKNVRSAARCSEPF